ncbi:MAG: hypothetical protein HEQ23_13270 [Tepidisphaera sp.]
MRFKQIAFMFLAFLSTMMHAGCASGPTAPDAGVADKYVGEWRSANSVFVSCFRRPDSTYILRSNRSGKERSSEGELIDVEGTMMVKVKVFEPNAEELSRGRVPLYQFGVLELSDSRLKYTPVRSAWLASTMRSHGLGEAVGGESATPGAGVGMPAEWSDLEHILRDAVTEDGALEPTESFEKVK